MKEQISNARLSSQRLFLEIVRENEDKMKSLLSEIQTARKDSSRQLSERLARLEKDLLKSAMQVVLFSAMSLEAYIYDYAARHLGDNYVHERLDKIDVVNKWMVIPALVTGRELSEQYTWLPMLKNLIKARNLLAHYKSSDLSVSEKDASRLLMRNSENMRFLLAAASKSTAVLRLLADKISEADPEETPWVHTYLF